MPNFIDAYMKHTQDFESPGSFWRWSAYATISAVLRDEVWKDDGDGKLYPNIYVLFLAGSGARKGRPVTTSESIVLKQSTTKVISGRASIQAIVDDLTMSESNPVTGKVQKAGAATFYAPELSAGIVTDPAAISILTDIYDGKANYTTALRGRGKSGGGSVVFTMLAASNEAMLEDTYTIKAIEGGLLARTFLVTPNEFRPSNSLLTKVDRSKSFQGLLDLIKVIGEVKGTVSFDEGATVEYELWYKSFREGYRTKVDRSGVMGRLHTGVMKLMIILAANNLTTHIRKVHVEEAIQQCLIILPNYQKFIMATGASDISKVGAKVLGELKYAPNYTLTKRDLLAKYWTDFTVEDLDQLTMNLDAAGYLEITYNLNGNTIYKLTDKCIEEMKGGS